MAIWKTKSVTDEPAISLRKWRIFETDDGRRHLVGARTDVFEGRVSSAVIELDIESQTAITETGRQYILVGAPGFDWDAAYVWYAWLKVNRVDLVRDVTFELFGGNEFE